MTIIISPFDTVFFKDGKPFSMGSESWADGLFPPLPSVFYGALRSAWFAGSPGELPKANTEDDPTKGLQITNIALAVNGVPYYAAPLDLVLEKTGKDEKLIRLNRAKNMGGLNNYPLAELLTINGSRRVEGAGGLLLEKSSMRDYLLNKESSFSHKALSGFVTPEPKTGIGRSDTTRSVKEGLLYRVGMRRLEGGFNPGGTPERLQFVISFEGIELPGRGLLKLGGENKSAAYETVDTPLPAAPKDGFLTEGGYTSFALYLATPAIFNGGWLPDLNQGPFKGLGAELIAAATGKYLPAGGFNLKANTPKPMLRAVPAGSVYYLKTKAAVNEVIATLHCKSVSEHKADEGFGVAYIGVIK